MITEYRRGKACRRSIASHVFPPRPLAGIQSDQMPCGCQVEQDDRMGRP